MKWLGVLFAVLLAAGIGLGFPAEGIRLETDSIAYLSQATPRVTFVAVRQNPCTDDEVCSTSGYLLPGGQGAQVNAQIQAGKRLPARAPAWDSLVFTSGGGAVAIALLGLFMIFLGAGADALIIAGLRHRDSPPPRPGTPWGRYVQIGSHTYFIRDKPPPAGMP